MPNKLMAILNADGHKAPAEVNNSASAIFRNPPVRRAVISYLNSLNEKVISRSSTLDATDVQGIFREIRKELRLNNKNLTLFIEDINAYTGMDKALIEILIDDEEDDDEKKEMCRLKSMVGSTDNFYDLLHTSLKARITDSVVVLDESVLSDDSKLLEFAARYINAVNVTEEQVDDWYLHNGKMPIAEIQNRVASIVLDGDEFSIFPFTKEAIINLFGCLDTNYRTPRGLLKYVVKHTLINWNTMEDRIFEKAASFTNIALKSFSALNLPDDVYRSTINMSDKEKQYIRIWGFDYKNNRIVNNSENEKKLFKINVADSIEPDNEQVQKQNIESKEKTDATTQVNKEKSKKEKALNHIEEWEKGINPYFVLHKDMREIMRRYILGHVNWQLEGVLYSKAEEVCKNLSFIEIEGHEGQGRYELFISRNSENADFFRALIYWNYDGDKKSWNFNGGVEEQIIAKAWFEKHRAEIIEAVKKYGRYEQVSEEYVVKAKIYSALTKGLLKSVEVDEVIEVLTHNNLEGVNNNKSEEWTKISNAICKNENEINKLFREYFHRAIGSADVNETPITFVDMIYLKQILMPVLSEIDHGNDKAVTMFDNKNLEAPITVINIYQQNRDSLYAMTKEIMDNAMPNYRMAFGDHATVNDINKAISKMGEYLEYVHRSVNTAVPANFIRNLEDDGAAESIVQMIELMKSIESEKNVGSRLIKMSNINDGLVVGTSNEIRNFMKFMSDVDKKFASNVNVDIEKDISQRKKDIEKMVKDLIALGGK